MFFLQKGGWENPHIAPSSINNTFAPLQAQSSHKKRRPLFGKIWTLSGFRQHMYDRSEGRKEKWIFS